MSVEIVVPEACESAVLSDFKRRGAAESIVSRGAIPLPAPDHGIDLEMERPVSRWVEMESKRRPV
jgi:hypothetical protein